MSSSAVNRQWLLVRRPRGQPETTDFELRSGVIPEPGAGEVLVRVLYAMMDPAIRGFMNESDHYGAPIPLGGPVRGMIAGKIVVSHSGALDEHQIVFGFGAWCDYVVGPAAQFHPLPTVLDYDFPLYTHVLGTIGLTAWYGLFDIAQMAAGETVLVSGAAGAVGSLVGQMAKLKGASHVVGIAGGAKKCGKAVERYGYDQCVDYKSVPDLSAAIGAAFPEGVDVCFENVGGATLACAIDHLAKNARIALCGMISGYNAATPQPGPSNLWNLVVQTASIRAFRVTDILAQHDHTARIFAQINLWIRQGKLAWDIDVIDGFESIPAAFGRLFTGAHDGRLVVRIASA